LRLRGLLLLPLVASCATTDTTEQPRSVAPPVQRQQEIHLAPNAPQDRPGRIAGQAKWQALVEPYAQKAKATYPAAKRRYLAGLPPQQTFFVTTLLQDGHGHFEYVFVVVQRIANQNVTGQIATDVTLVQGYQDGDTVNFPEAEVVDWMISKPDGSEEGNLVGKFLDTQSQGASKGARSRARKR
jgi:hypothetical protein